MVGVRRSAAKVIVFVGILAFAAALGVSSAAAQDNQLGICPMFSEALINDCFKQWIEKNRLDPEGLKADCYDDPAMPSTSMALRDRLEEEFANVTVIGGVDDQANIYISKYGDIDEKCCVGGYCGGPVFTEPKVAKWHICRAEILRSSYWRRYCAKNVGQK